MWKNEERRVVGAEQPLRLPNKIFRQLRRGIPADHPSEVQNTHESFPTYMRNVGKSLRRPLFYDSLGGSRSFPAACQRAGNIQF